jgi:trk system potassium uptake protein
VEVVGAILIYLCWLFDGDQTTTFLTALFHSVSALNNCGMDIFGNFKSMSDFQGNASILFITALIIILGSTGYTVIADSVRNRRFIKLSLDSKLVLVTTFSLLILGTLFYCRIFRTGNVRTFVLSSESNGSLLFISYP